jgi:endonuclease/exonuclease/phosphatase family metal-dependent hydrolase
VPEELRREFEVLARGDAFARDGRRGPSFGLPLPPPGTGEYEDREDDSPGLAVLQERVDQLIHAYRVRGHLHASRHWKFLREADSLVDAIAHVSQHRRTVIAGSFNSRSPLDGETEYIHTVVRLLNAGYIDTFAATHPSRREATKLNGKNSGHRIDYVFVSADLRPALTAAGVDTSTSYPEHSDHRPVWADLDFSRQTASATR